MSTKSLVRTVALRQLSFVRCQCFSSYGRLESGHNRWSKIKHDKMKEDKLKSKERTFLALNVIKASKEGGPDPKLNPSLAYAITNAKRGQLSKEAIERSIAKGQGKSLSGAPLETLLVEAMLPHGVAAVMEYLTENKTRVLQEVRMVVQRAGGSVTPTAFLFDKKGKIWFQAKEGVGTDEVMDEAIDAGAEDILMEEDQVVVETAPDMITAVGQKLKDVLGLEVERSEILYDPKEELLVRLDESQSSEIQSVVDMLEGQDDLQELYINVMD